MDLNPVYLGFDIENVEQLGNSLVFLNRFGRSYLDGNPYYLWLDIAMSHS